MICKANDKRVAEFLYSAIEKDQFIDIKIHRETRTNQQNKALHLWFKHISDTLNEAGETFYYKGISGKEFEIPFNEKIVKEFIVKPLIDKQFEINSTTKLTTQMINQMIDVMNVFLSKRGEYVPFPNWQDLAE